MRLSLLKWIFSIYIIAVSPTAFSQIDSAKAYQSLEAKVQRLLTKVIVPPETACQMRFAIIRYNLNKSSFALDSISLKSNLTATEVEALKQGLNTLDVSWKNFITAEELEKKPILQIVFIKDVSEGCGTQILNEQDGLSFQESLDELTGKPPVIGAAKWRGLPALEIRVYKSTN